MDTKVAPETPTPVSDIELQDINTVQRLTQAESRKSAANAAPEGATETPVVIGDSLKTKRTLYSAVAALWILMFMAGWNDATTGPLLLTIQAHYHLSYTVVSLIFIFNLVGWLLAAFLNVHMTDRYGFGVVVAFGAVCQAVAYALMSAAPPFEVFCLAFVISGVGMGVQDALANTFVSRLPNTNTNFSLLHAVYGVGALVAPLVATQFAGLPHWNYHYLVSLGIAVADAAALMTVFRFKNEDQLLGPTPPEHVNTDSNAKFKEIMTSKMSHILAGFTLLYVGIEVTVGGWIVAFIEKYRGGGASSGYVSSGFFGGLTVGRVVFIWVNNKIGEERVIFLYTILAIGLEIVIWLVPHIVGDAVAVSFVGMFLGPFYPIIMNVTARVIPRSLLSGTIAWIASLGQAGSAIFPFVTGALASKYGVIVLEPMVVAMLGALGVLWVVVVVSGRRKQD